MNIRFNTGLMRIDAVEKGFTQAALARKARVSQVRAWRFLNGESKSPATAKRLAQALGYEVRRYLIADEAEVA